MYNSSLWKSMGYRPCKHPIDTPVSESPPQWAPLVAAARTPHEGTPQHLLLMVVDSMGTEFHSNTVFTWMSRSLNRKC